MNIETESFVFVGADKDRTEWQIFQAFCEVQPNFAGRPLKDWDRVVDDPPDFLCHDFSGKRIGVELTEWLNESQIASNKAWQNLDAVYSSIIGSEQEIPPRNIEMVTIQPDPKGRRPFELEEKEFRRQLFDLIREVSSILEASPQRSLQDCERFEFPNHPSLSKHLAWIKFWPCRPTGRIAADKWVGVQSWSGGFYSPTLMVDTLIENIRKKTAKYSTLRAEKNIDELYLVAVYNKALLYNSPYDTPSFGFRDVADLVSQELAINPGPYQRVFLFSPVEKSEKVLRVWPSSTLRTV